MKNYANASSVTRAKQEIERGRVCEGNRCRDGESFGNGMEFSGGKKASNRDEKWSEEGRRGDAQGKEATKEWARRRMRHKDNKRSKDEPKTEVSPFDTLGGDRGVKKQRCQ